MAQMSKRERVLAAVRGEAVDHTPVSFWGHNFARENSAQDLAEETLRIARTFEWDFVKVQSRFSCFAECYGGIWQPSGQHNVMPTLVKPAAETVADLERVEPVEIQGGPLGEQIEALRLIRAGLPDDRPVIMTVFSPLMVLRYFFREGAQAVVSALRIDPEQVEGALAPIASTLASFSRACVEAGADGIFFATNVATSDLLEATEIGRFERPFDLQVLAAVSQAPFNMMHVCGERAHFEQFVDYPVACFNWALGDGNPDLIAGMAQTGRAVAGGLSAKLPLRTMTPEQVAAEARAALAQTGGLSHLLAPACSIDPDTPPTNLMAAREVARGTQRGA